MKKWLVLVIILFLFIGAIGIGVVLWRRYLKNRTITERGCQPYEAYTTCLSNGNIAGIEKKFDIDIPPPATTLTIKYFGKTEGYPWCIPTRYAIKYIDTDGNYGPLSEWSEEVVASKKADSGCSSNVPQLELSDSNGLLPSYAIVNVYRETKNTKGDWGESELIGSLLPFINEFIDIDNPNKSGLIPECSGC